MREARRRTRWVLALLCCLSGRDSSALQSGSEGGWTTLTGDEDLAAWRAPHGEWASVPGVRPRESNRRFLEAEAGHGAVVYNGPRGKTPNLISRQWFGDVELRCEFLVPEGSNSGIKFEGLYEIQIADSFGKSRATASDCGGIYPRAELFPMYHHIDDGIPPSRNACAPPGTWQTLEVVFLAPRFDEAGRKVRAARFERVVLNGEAIHEGVELAHPTGHAWHKAEVPEGPILLQGDHGPVAFRNLQVKPLGGQAVEVTQQEPARRPSEGGINHQFENPQLRVDDFVKRFEAEDRDIYKNREAIAGFVGLRPGDSIADVGAGTGVFTRLFAERVGPNGRVYAVDIAKPFLEHIGAEAKKNGWEQVRTVLGGQDTTNLGEQSVDVVFICDTYHHFEKPVEVMMSIHRALKPGGRLVVIEFDRREGISSDFILKHVRASRVEFEREIARAGFEKIESGEAPPLGENFASVFRKVERAAAGGEGR